MKLPRKSPIAKHAILVKDSDSGDGTWFQCPDCGHIFLVMWSSVERHGSQTVCGRCPAILSVDMILNIHTLRAANRDEMEM